MSEWITKKNKSKYIQKKEPEKTWITIKDSKDSKLEEINDMLKDKTDDANKMFKMKTYKKGGLVKKGKPRLTKRGWK